MKKSPTYNQAPQREISFLTQEELKRLFAAMTFKCDCALFSLAYQHDLRVLFASHWVA